MKWPYPNELNQIDLMTSDVLVLGGGIAGCYAAIAAARAGKSVVLVEKGATIRSGSTGSGFDHWESACTNPASKVTPKEIAEAYIEEQDEYSNGIFHYIACREGWDRLLDMEDFGGKIRDTKDEFKGAEFRDEQSRLLFAYDYRNKFTLRVWGSTFKPALYRELKKLGVKICDYTEATALLTSDRDNNSGSSADGGSGSGKSGIGAVGMNIHTGKLMVFLASATVLCMSRPARIWLFNPDLMGLSEFRPPQSIGSGHAMGWRIGMEFTLMEKSVRAEYSAAGRSFPAYGTGNNHNTWYAATMVDANGREIPYVDRDGRILKTVSERYQPAPGQKFFLKGGVIDDAKYPFRGPETMDTETLLKNGYKLPFYADLSRMPDTERRAIWGLMVGEEGKTKIPIYENYTRRGFDPTKDMLQSYGTGWKSAAFLGQERQLFGAPGGIVEDWDLMTNIPGIFAAGDQLFGTDCAGAAAATGYYAGRKAARYSGQRGLITQDEAHQVRISHSVCPVGNSPAGNGSAASSLKELLQTVSRSMRCPISRSNLEDLEEQVDNERNRLYSPLYSRGGMDWRELNMAIAKAMQNYCGEVKNEEELDEGLSLLGTYTECDVPLLVAHNPHELMRIHEVLDILDVAKMILYACKARKSSSKPLNFKRSDYPEMDPPRDRRFITVRQEEGRAVSGEKPLDYYRHNSDVETEYERHNQDYIEEREQRYAGRD